MRALVRLPAAWAGDELLAFLDDDARTLAARAN
jgi:hypothetical protein